MTTEDYKKASQYFTDVIFISKIWLRKKPGGTFQDRVRSINIGIKMMEKHVHAPKFNHQPLIKK